MKKHFHTCLLLFFLSSIYNLPVLAQWYSATITPGRWWMATTSVGNRALFAGGYRYNSSFVIPTNQVHIYDGVTNQWTTASLSQNRFGIAAISVGDLAFFAGGQSNLGVMGNSFYSNVDIYNATTNQWATARLSQARTRIAVASTGGKVIFGGGITTGYFPTTTVDIYDISTNQWSVIQLPETARYWSSIIGTSVGNKVLFKAPGSQTCIYDVSTGQWTTGGPYTGPTVVTLGNKAFFAGGNGSATVDIYDAGTNQWTTAQLSQARSTIAAISLGNKVFFAGGSPASNAVDIYDTNTNQWSTAQLSEGRSAIAATSAGNKVFFAGSSTGSTVVDMYDTTTDQWSVTQLPQAKNSLLAVSAGERALFAENAGGYETNIPSKVDIYTTNSALPVNLISFSGIWTENVGAQLNWQTSLETNNDHFEIQRSDNAKSFETIGRVQGKGSIEARTDYTFTDPDMPGQIGYYRLKQVDFDGSAHFSKIISVNRRESSSQTASLSIWPIPVTSSLTLKLSTTKAISQVAVYDLQGRQRLAAQTENPSTADVSGLPAGVYLLDVLTTDGQRLHKHFLKQ